ncbi:hypothetical protein OHS70_38595 (plasmid) [Streptomyces sp. NBC_00390]|uniref:hypothetical protein n=1 Tax=Streptomyces sp. NBC_00390 TaxID=2975736 RepID=UPI002E1F0BF8
MAAVPLTLSPTRPVDDRPYFTTPLEAAAPPVTVITPVAKLDKVLETVKCSCNAGDDNPH